MATILTQYCRPEALKNKVEHSIATKLNEYNNHHANTRCYFPADMISSSLTVGLGNIRGSVLLVGEIIFRR